MVRFDLDAKMASPAAENREHITEIPRAPPLHLGTGQRTARAQGCAGDPNMLGRASTFNLHQTSSGQGALLNQPVLLILAQPHGTAAGSIGGTAQLFLKISARHFSSCRRVFPLSAKASAQSVQRRCDVRAARAGAAAGTSVFLVSRPWSPALLAVAGAGRDSSSRWPERWLTRRCRCR